MSADRYTIADLNKISQRNEALPVVVEIRQGDRIIATEISGCSTTYDTGGKMTTLVLQVKTPDPLQPDLLAGDGL